MYDNAVELAENPAVLQLKIACGHARLIALNIHERKARGVPDLVDKMAVAFDALFGQADIAALGSHGRQGEAEAVRAEFFDNLQRVDDVALGFAHLLAFRVAHQGMNVDIPERHVTHELQAHHHHAGHPEEKNVKAGHQAGGRIEVCKLRVFPASPGSKTATGPS